MDAKIRSADKEKFFRGGVVNNKIYAIGGEILGSGWPTGIVEMYDPAIDSWTSRASLNTASAYLCACAINDKIYVMGGRHTYDFERYDVSTDSWTKLTQLPFQLKSAAAVSLNGRLYIIGGFVDANYSNAIYEYLP
jgi:N-acetylneuraminic acid mutarotase